MRTFFFHDIFIHAWGADVRFESNRIVTCKIVCEQCSHDVILVLLDGT
jgi:hypothetical protein